MRVASTLSYSALSDFDIEPFDVAPTAIGIDGGGGNGISNVCGTSVTDSGSRTKGQAGWVMIDTNNGWLSLDSEL